MRWLFLVAGIAVISLLALLAWPRASITVCNATPYNIKVATAFNVKTGFEISGLRGLQSGSCWTGKRRYTELVDPEVYVHARGLVQDNYHAQNSNQNYLTRFDEDVSAYWSVPDLNIASYGEITFNQGGERSHEFISCVPFSVATQWENRVPISKQVGEDGVTAKESTTGECVEGELVGGFFLAGRNAEPFKGHLSSNVISDNDHWSLPLVNIFRRDWLHIIEHPGWSFGDVDPINPRANIESALEKASATRGSLYRQFTAETYFSNKEPVALLGAKLEDTNSNLNPGVNVYNVAAVDIFQEVQNLRNGDVIMSVNGTSVFSVSEVIYELQMHANDMNKGIDVPLELVVRNSSSCISGCLKPTRYFFNARTLLEVSDLQAGYYGFADMATFGAAASTTCGAKQVGEKVGNALSGLADWVGSKIDEREFDRSSLNRFETENFELCRWRTIQRKAFARQTKLDYYDNASYLGFITPGGVRMLFTKSARKGTAKAVGKGMVSRSLADAGLEAAESMVWAMGTAAPGSSLSDRFSKAAKVAPIGAGLGFATGVVGEQLKLGRKK